MIDVGMGEDYGIELFDRKRQPPVFFRRLLSSALKHSAIERDSAAVHAQEVAGARDFAGRAYESQLHFSFLLARHAEIEPSACARPVTSVLVPTLLCFSHSEDR